MDIMEFLNKFAESFLLAIAPVVASALALWVIAKVKIAWREFERENPDLAYDISWVACQAVRAAEQAGSKGLITDKKAYAIAAAEKWLLTKGVTIDLDLLSAAIESAVFSELNREKLTGIKLPEV